jgi:hypothetical protein
MKCNNANIVPVVSIAIIVAVTELPDAKASPIKMMLLINLKLRPFEKRFYTYHTFHLLMWQLALHIAVLLDCQIENIRNPERTVKSKLSL